MSRGQGCFASTLATIVPFPMQIAGNRAMGSMTELRRYRGRTFPNPENRVGDESPLIQALPAKRLQRQSKPGRLNTSIRKFSKLGHFSRTRLEFQPKRELNLARCSRSNRGCACGGNLRFDASRRQP